MPGREGNSEAEYRPMMSPGNQQRIREWHESAYAEMTRTETIQITRLGLNLTIPPQVFAPPPMPSLLAEIVQTEVQPSDQVLDVGTGSGINAILAAASSSNVVATDINPHAVECARANAKANGVGGRIEFFESDVFDKVEGGFDLIIFDPPFRWYAPRDLVETAITDENYRALTRFMAQARTHLRENGRILLSFGTSGDLDYFLALIDSGGFNKEVVSELELVREQWTVNYYVFRLTAN